MTLKNVPPLVRWIALTSVLWCGWGTAVWPTLTRQIHAIDRKHDDTDRQLAALREHVDQVPVIAQRIDSCRSLLDSHLAGFATTQDIDGLMGTLYAAGVQHGLSDLRTEPDLNSLLHASHSGEARRLSMIQLDTLVVTVSARGGFLTLGAWLDDIERRPGFRTWISCHWNSREDDDCVAFEGRAILLVADRPEPVEKLVKGGA